MSALNLSDALASARTTQAGSFRDNVYFAGASSLDAAPERTFPNKSVSFSPVRIKLTVPLNAQFDKVAKKGHCPKL